jgi:hypothetical protein
MPAAMQGNCGLFTATYGQKFAAIPSTGADMNPSTPIDMNSGMDSAGGGGDSKLTLEIQHVDHADAAQFRAALERHMGTDKVSAAGGAGGKNPSLGDKLALRATDLAGDIKQDQQHVSKMLEHASRTGDSMQLMKAMMALSDYQIRVQTVAKTVSKATQAFEQLTKLQ